MKNKMVGVDIFDSWAVGYDEEVRTADENNEYPFAGYSKIMSKIYDLAMAKCSARVLDVGIGTGVLSAQLYASGNSITGIDFSDEMLTIAQNKMPKANFYQCDFAEGLPLEISNQSFDYIISTYALHHLPDHMKAELISQLLKYLDTNGMIIIGDIGFTTRTELNNCKAKHEGNWDDDEYYFVFSELKTTLQNVCIVEYEQISHCGGIMILRPFFKA